MRFLPFALVGLLWLYCLVEVITSREDSVRNLAKSWWLLIVLFFPLAARSRGSSPGVRSTSGR